MNKAELTAVIAEKTGFTKKESEAALKAVVEGVTEALEKGDKVQIVGFGSFEVRERVAHEGHNPHSGKKIMIPASKKPAFRAGKALRDAVNK